MNKSTLSQALQSNPVLVADGATGTNLQGRGLPPGLSPDQWVFDNPEQVLQLHRDFIAAGSNIILTNSFGGTSIRQRDGEHSGQAPALNHRAAALARQAAGPVGVLVGGSIGPTGLLLKPYGPLEPSEAQAAFAEQAAALTAGGVDFLLIETQFDLSEARAALNGVRQASSLPVVISFSFDRGARTMMGIKPAQVVETFAPLGVAALGANCGKSLEFMEQIVTEMKAALQGNPAYADLPIWAKPNAGMPVAGAFPPQYDTSPEQMGAAAVRLVQAGARIVGGCCGSTPEHVREIARQVRSL